MQKLPALELGKFYHIYNRGINRQNIFFQPRNYNYFMTSYVRFIEPIAETYAYCLLKNHFHLLVRIKELTVASDKPAWRLPPTQQYSNFFNSYAKAVNNMYQRTGSLFQHRFGRIEVDSARYFVNLIHYVHFNPQKHGFVEDFRDYPILRTTSC